MTIQLNLPPDLELFVATQAKSEGHTNPDAFVLDVLRRLQAATLKADIEAKLVKGVEQLNRGEGFALKEADWAKLRVDFSQRHGIADEV